ncbi:MAG: sodium:solute symporter [Verrucomicrobiales bacterium]|nr:sodium:solute symporter [Verrucomicrobiales bacterium]
MQRLSAIDLTVLGIYLIAVVGLGAWFARRNRTSAHFMAASGSLPGWVVGLSIFGTFLSSNTFIGVPGKAYGGNWNAFVFSLTLPLAAWVAVKYFVPFYRGSGEISAYQHLEKRFGPWARSYALACYLLTQLARVGAILFGVSMALHALTGWSLPAIIIGAGVAVTLYTLLGGIEAVIWTDVIQSLVLLAGAVVIAVLLITGHPNGASEALHGAAAANKFSLGSFATDFTQSTVWVILLFGFFINLNNFGIDQNYVQRYHAARDDAAARRSVWLGALLYVPVSALFFLIGSLLFSYYEASPALLQELQAAHPEGYADQVLPHFIAHKLPVGMAGLLLAAICAAAMSSIDTSLNSSATVTLKDFFQRHLKRGESETDALKILRGATLFWGVLGTGVALAMMGQKSLLDAWWKLSGIFAGGMLGLFLLGLIARKADNVAALTGVIIGVLVICWTTFADAFPENLRSPFHANMITVIGTLTIFLVGLGVSRIRNSMS